LAAEPQKEDGNPLARPLLRPEERKDEVLPAVRVTAAERIFVEEQAANAGLSLSEYQRLRLLKKKVPPRRASADQALLVELNRVGVNLNQIARRINAGRNLPPDFPDLLAEVRAAVQKVLTHGS